ncbi:hypothetical protein [Sodalis sp. (in: enterobacteria)]|uniref:hypothetical protein n=1 Tax=Sodalis sp. (in: enterobacteria) TaxID=1898979 RepID=UPI003F389708
MVWQKCSGIRRSYLARRALPYYRQGADGEPQLQEIKLLQVQFPTFCGLPCGTGSEVRVVVGDESAHPVNDRPTSAIKTIIPMFFMVVSREGYAEYSSFSQKLAKFPRRRRRAAR